MISGRKVILLSLLLILVLGSLVVPAIAQDGITIRVWRHVDAGSNDGDDALAAAYIEANPVVISFESFDYPTYSQILQTELVAGTEADVLRRFGVWVYGYAEGGRLAPISETVVPFIEIFPYKQFIEHLPNLDLLFYDITLPYIYNAMLGIETIDEVLQAIHDEASVSL